ncbi:MAG TPA: hypothetical protein VKB46_13035 [Pyrinomonadaceae bacterium]|nr:hypothetical protein [Pyrinomonadaceae bacterium]
MSELFAKPPGTARIRLPPLLRELLIFLAFLIITAGMTWPWARYLNDAIADNGDSYAFVWSLWWNFHQTFHDPVNLFQGNIFFPYRYTLAFTEHGYGVAIFFFPLFAIGLRPLTVYSIATFICFAASGYGMFRLVRTLTESYGAALVAGIFFAFVPYRFMFITALPYLWTAWLPLLVEALVLFSRQRSWRRASWLGVTFLMTGLTCVNWFLLALTPFILSWLLIALRLRIFRDRAFWIRGMAALAVASLLLLPFLWPYYKANQLYGFRRDLEEVTQNSASLADWVYAPGYNKLWNGLGSGLHDAKAPLFPGLTAIFLVLGAILLRSKSGHTSTEQNEKLNNKKWLRSLDAICLMTACIAAAAVRFGSQMADIALVALLASLLLRLSIAYPAWLKRGDTNNLVEWFHSPHRDDPFLLGALWAGVGILLAFGMKTFLYRTLYNFVVPFQSIRSPTRAGMICFVGLGILMGVGATRLSKRLVKVKPWLIYSILAAALLFELHAAPLPFIHGAVFPDPVTRQLATLKMRGGIVEFPSLPQPPYYSWHLSMLRAADHGHPVVFAASSFIPHLTMKLHGLTNGANVSPEVLDLLEEIPVSYVVMRWQMIAADKQTDFRKFFWDARQSGRMKLVGVYGADELYSVTRTEPETR